MNTENTITLEQIEYKEMLIKAWKYDQLRKRALKSSFLTEIEKAIFEIPEEEAENVDG